MTAGTLTLALKSAQSGLMTTQSALSTVSQNITNVNTPGYSRKVLHLEERVLAGVGAGVQVAGVERSVDAGLLRDIVRETSDLNALTIQKDYYERLETTFGQPSANSSIAHTLSELKSAIDSLAASPQSTLAQSEAIRWAENVAIQLSTMSETIQELRLQADQEIAVQTSRANELIGDIADMNDKIVRNTAINNDVSDLLDRRDQSLIELSSIVDIQYFERTSGEVAVFTKTGRVLVDNGAQTISHTSASAVAATTSHSEGDFTGIYVGLPVSGNDITNDLVSGDLKGLVELRDNILYDSQRELDELADKLKSTINQVHNSGVAYPGAQSMTGTRNFIDTSQQTMSLAANDDVRFVLFDSSGVQQASVTLDTLMTGTTYGSTVALPSGGPWTVQEVGARMEGWMDSVVGAQASVSFSDGATAGNMQIDLGNTSFNLAIRDENARSTVGAGHEDAVITHNPTGVVGQTSETVSGFSSFMGLNDVYVDNANRTTWESDILPSTYSSNGATLMFYDSDSGLGAGNEVPTGGLTIFAGSSLDEIAKRINNDVALSASFEASVINEGAGQRLRITNSNGKESYIATPTAQTFLTDMGMKESTIGAATVLNIRSDLLASPGKFASAEVQYDATIGTGQYYVSTGDNTTVTALSNAFNGSTSFEASGSSVITSSTIESFATQLLSRTASLAANNTFDTDNQSAMVDSLSFKLDTVKGVNLDEEMASLILYEQAYAASARVISIIQDMFDTLENAVR